MWSGNSLDWIVGRSNANWAAVGYIFCGGRGDGLKTCAVVVEIRTRRWIQIVVARQETEGMRDHDQGLDVTEKRSAVGNKFTSSGYNSWICIELILGSTNRRCPQPQPLTLLLLAFSFLFLSSLFSSLFSFSFVLVLSLLLVDPRRSLQCICLSLSSLFSLSSLLS